MALNEPLVPLLLDDITEPQVVVPLALQSDQMCKCVSKYSDGGECSWWEKEQEERWQMICS